VSDFELPPVPRLQLTDPTQRPSSPLPGPSLMPPLQFDPSLMRPPSLAPPGAAENLFGHFTDPAAGHGAATGAHGGGASGHSEPHAGFGFGPELNPVTGDYSVGLLGHLPLGRHLLGEGILGMNFGRGNPELGPTHPSLTLGAGLALPIGNNFQVGANFDMGIDPSHPTHPHFAGGIFGRFLNF
jgi:hypothetical protein